MKLKELKPGMVIRCENDKELEMLLDEAKRQGYIWRGGMDIDDFRPNDNKTIHFSDMGENTLSKHITRSNAAGSRIFRDLILPEMTAKEMLEWMSQNYLEAAWESCFGDRSFHDVTKDFRAEEIINRIEQWKADHEKKGPVLEWVDVCRIIQVHPSGRKRCVYEEDIREDELPFGYQREAVERILKKYISGHEGKFIAVVEDVCRAKGE